MATTHVLIFEGEVPEVVLCDSLDEAVGNICKAFELDDEGKKSLTSDLNENYNWSFDNEDNRFRFSTGFGELETVTIYVVTAKASQ